VIEGVAGERGRMVRGVKGTGSGEGKEGRGRVREEVGTEVRGMQSENRGGWKEGKRWAKEEEKRGNGRGGQRV